MNENLIVIRNILYKCFLVGLFFLVFALIIYMPYKTFFATFYASILGISLTSYYLMWACFIGLMKTIIIFLFLVPALAIHLTTSGCCCKKKSDNI
jgi:hypothetical protein